MTTDVRGTRQQLFDHLNLLEEGLLEEGLLEEGLPETSQLEKPSVAEDGERKGLTNDSWLREYARLLTHLEEDHISLSRSLIEEARRVFLEAVVYAILLIATVLTFVFLFVFRTQRKNLQDSQSLNRTLEMQRQTLLSTQRVMVSITDDEQRANQRAEQLASLVEQSSEAIIQLSRGGYVQHYNRATTKLFPGIRTLGPDKPFAHLFEASYEVPLTEAISKSLSEDNVTTFTPQNQNLNRALEFTITPVKSTAVMQTQSVSILVRDVSSLLQEQEQLKLIISNAPNALFVCDENSIITVANIHSEQLFGYAEGEMIGMPVDNLVALEQRTDHVKKRNAFIAKPASTRMGEGRKVMALRQNGSMFQAEIGLNPIYINGNLLVIASIFDLTEQLRHSDELAIANQQLELRNKEMEQFIYTVSHDLKSPLFTISGFTHRLKDSIENITEDQLNKIGRIQANVDRMGKLLEDLLQLSRVIRIELEKTDVKTEVLVSQVLATLESSVSQANATINIRTPLINLYGNEGMLFQCIQNLLTNAIKYSREGIAPVVEIYTEASSDSIAICCTDNGCGIDPKHHERVFQIFQRLDKREGTGVGLSIVKAIVDRHDGRVELTSESEQGSTFKLIFPKNRVA